MTARFRDPITLPFLDRLTQLYNWWFMAQYLRERFPWLASEKVPLSVIMLNLDDFRKVNEAHGRLTGDVVLKRVAELLQTGRQRGEYAIRYAGDEFFVFLERMEAAQALVIAEELRQQITTQPVVVPNMPAGVPIHASCGVAAFPEEVQTASGLIEKVRHAVGRSKQLGKNRVCQDTGERLPTDKEALAHLHRPRLLGRDQELGRCKALFEQAPSVRNSFIFIDGEHGSGKSRFLVEFPGLARTAGIEFVQAGCLPDNHAVPYSAVTPWLQEYFDRSPERVARVMARLGRPKLAALTSVLPVLDGAQGSVQAIPAPERRRLLYQGMLDLLCLITERTPLLVLIENLHWADEASLAVLLHLLSREDGKVIICGTAVIDSMVEAESDVKGRSLQSLLPDFESSAHFHRITLSPLTFLQVSELARDIVRHTIPARFHQMLYQVSRGVPLLVEETLKDLIKRGVLREEEGTWNFEQLTPQDFPASSDEAIGRRLEFLEPETLELVSEASVIGPELDLPLLADVLGKDPAETLQIVDRGRRDGVFQDIDPVADPGDIRFTHERLQEIVYDGLDPSHRRESHQKVAEAYERLKGDQATEVVGPLAYHFERSTDQNKAAVYREKLREVREWLFSWVDATRADTDTDEVGETGAVKVRIPEATQPIEDSTVPLAGQFVRTLTLTTKNIRVFPEGSELVRSEVMATTGELLKLLDRLDGVTLAEHRQALLVNGRILEGKALAAAAQELLRFFTEHGIRSVTFVRGVDESEMWETLKMLGGPPLGILPQADRWEEVLSSRGIAHAGVLPALYLDTQKKDAAKPEDKEALLDDQTLRLTAEVFRTLMGAVDNLRLYPPESELNILVQDRLSRQAQALLDRVPVVTLALAEETIVINGAKANPRLFGITIPLLRKLFHEGGLTSLTLTRGVSREDLGVFVRQMAGSRDSDQQTPALWGKLLADHGITTIQVGTRAYAAAWGSLIAEDGAPKVSASRTANSLSGDVLTEEDRLLRQAVQWLEDGSTPAGFRPEEIPPTVESWLASEREDPARKLWDRIVTALANPMEGPRQRGASAICALLSEGGPRTLSWIPGQSLEPLDKALVKEMSVQPFQWEVRAAAEALKLFLKQGDLTGSTRLAHALGKGQTGKPTQAEFLAEVASAAEALAAAGGLAPVIAALGDSDSGRREQGMAVLSALGEAALSILINLIVGEESEEVRKAAASLLRELPGAGLRQLVPRLQGSAPAEASRRIVSVLDILAPELGSEFFPLLAHPDVLVRAEFTAVISRLPRAAALRFLDRALEERDRAIVAAALECIRSIRAVELLEPVVRLARRGDAPEVLKASCLCLGHLKDERGVRPLVEILQRRPRFLGLVKGLPETVRATAARALGDFPIPEAQRGLRTALRDSSLAVRSSARLALARLHQARKPQ